MSTTQRRRGIRFPWQTDADQAANGETEAIDVVAAVGADMPATAQLSSASMAEPTQALANHVPVPDDFLHELVDAMRHVAEQQRDEAIAQLRAAVAEQTAGVRTSAETRAAELRDRADGEITMIADWEQVEIQRIREEAVTKTAFRRQRLDEELVTSNAESQAAQDAADRVIESFEASMDEFFAKLTAAADPVAFASAAMQMPQPPAMEPLSGSPEGDASRPEPVPWPDENASVARTEPVAEVKASVDTTARAKAGKTAPAAEPVAEVAPISDEVVAAESTAAAVAPEMPAAPETATDATEVSTQIVVSGLTSFGAITTFKQSLERVDGVGRVSLGLGTAGEFIFTAVHPDGFDLSSAIRTFESSAQFHVVEDRLSVTVGAAG